MALSGPIAIHLRKPLPATPRWRQTAFGYALVGPALALVLGMFAYPLLYEVQLSLTDTQSAAPSAGEYVGLQNYFELFGSRVFWEAMRNTTFLVALTASCEVLLGVAVALLLWGRTWLRPVLYAMVFLPWIYPSTFANYTWYWIILPPFHTFYTLQVIQARFWLESIFGEQAWQILSFALVCTWRGSSILALVLLAGFRAIPSELLDVGRLEVAQPFTFVWRVVLPLARRFLGLAVVVAITVAYVDYLAMYLESNGRITVPVLGTLVYQAQMMDGRTGYAAALSLVQLPVVAVLVLVAFPLLQSQMSRRKPPETPDIDWRRPITSRAQASHGASHEVVAADAASHGASHGEDLAQRASHGASHRASRAPFSRQIGANLGRSFACLAIAAFYLLPLYYTAVQSVKSQQDFIKGPLGQPFWIYRFDFRDGVLDTLRSVVFWRSALVTLEVFGTVILVGTIASLAAAYALARLELPGHEWLARLLFVAYFVPQLAVMVPLLQLYAAVGLENSLLGLVLLYLTMAIPFATWLFCIYFLALDPEAEDHARLDASRLRVFLSVVLPRTWPVVIAAAVFSIGMMSSDLLYGRIFTVSSAIRTLPMTMGSLVYDPDNWADANAAILLGALPLLLMALALGRWFVGGLRAAFSEQ